MYYIKNLTQQSLFEGYPWDFKPEEMPSAQICHDKQSRQEWYRNTATQWQFYTGFEPLNPRQRMSRDNPPHKLHAIVADYDLPIDDSVIKRAIDKMQYKPSWVERSLGGNSRLVFLFAFPLPLEGQDFAVFVMQLARKWLRLDLLPGLDAPALEDPARLYCSGVQWNSTGFGPILENTIQSFFVDCGRKFAFNSALSFEIPLDSVEKLLKEKYSNFNWPVEFIIDSQGPSFWIPESVSPLSAIVKKDGMFTFSAHAEKSFYSWSDLLGSEAIEKYRQAALAEATKDIWFDGQFYWRKQHDIWIACKNEEIELYWTVDCGISPSKKGGNPSLLDEAKRHVHDKQRIHGAGVLVFFPYGVIKTDGELVLNTYVSNVLKPASEPTVWGVEGKFPFLSKYLDSFFAEPRQVQLNYWLAWLKVFYKSGLDLAPIKGHTVAIFGGPDVGKNFNDRGVVGGLVGGFADASAFITSKSQWNSDLLKAPLWCVDDEGASSSQEGRDQQQNLIKKFTANSDFRFTKRFHHEVRVPWHGRIMLTGNLDMSSAKNIPRMDNTTADKIILFRAVDEPQVEWGPEEKMKQILADELPYFARWLVDWAIPDSLITGGRYTIKSYHHPDLLDRAFANSPEATFKELLIELLTQYFVEDSDSDEWKGSSVGLYRMLYASSANYGLMRTFSPNLIDRYMANIQREGVVKCEFLSGPNRTSIWRFKRSDIIK